jgi:hypothetical protein
VCNYFIVGSAFSGMFHAPFLKKTVTYLNMHFTYATIVSHYIVLQFCITGVLRLPYYIIIFRKIIKCCPNCPRGYICERTTVAVGTFGTDHDDACLYT